VGGTTNGEDVNDPSYQSDFSETEGYSTKYLEKMSRLSEYGDGIVLAHAARLYKRPIIVLSNGSPIFFESADVPVDAEPIILGWMVVGNHSSEKNHYVSPIRQSQSGKKFTTILWDSSELSQNGS